VDGDNVLDTTPLMVAAGKGHRDIVELLITNGAEINAKDSLNDDEIAERIAAMVGAILPEGGAVEKTALHLAAVGGHKEVVELLIANGADVNVMDAAGQTPLYYAVSRGHKESTELLIAEGVDVNAKDSDGVAPLHMAIHLGYKEVAELLIAEGADVNAKDNNRRTSLHYAAFKGHKEIAELLIAEGADVSAKNENGYTPLDMADDKETADLLRKHGGKTSEELKAEGK